MMWDAAAAAMTFKEVDMLRKLIVVVVVSCTVFCLPTACKAASISKEAKQAYVLGYRYWQAGRIAEAVTHFQAFLEMVPEGAAARKAKAMLVKCGVGKEVHVILNDRKVFNKRLGITEESILKTAEKTLSDLRKRFEPIKPYFEDCKIKLSYYSSQAVYKKLTKSLTSSGIFRLKKCEVKRKALDGEIQWYFKQSMSPKDRELNLKSMFYHEFTHYLNKIHFGPYFPKLFEEGMAVYMQCNLNTEYYQAVRTTDRRRYEGVARISLNTIKNYDDFLVFVNAQRGFGTGGQMITRWYSLCYLVIDFFQRGEINRTKASFAKLLAQLSRKYKVTDDRVKRTFSRFTAQQLLEDMVKTAYGVDLRTFHKALLNHAIKNYRQN